MIVLDLSNNDFPNSISVKKKAEHSITALTNLSNNKFTTGNQLSTIEIWDAENDFYERLDRLSNITHGIFSLLYIIKRNLLISSTRSCLNVWNLDECQRIGTIETCCNGLLPLLLLPGGYFASGSTDQITIWDIDSFECINTFEVSGNYIMTSIQLLKDGRIASATYDGKVHIYS
jgi:WD40 repeat protein